jgi:hypothetical protein
MACLAACSSDSIFQLKLCSFRHIIDYIRPNVNTFVSDIVDRFLPSYFVDSAHLKGYKIAWTCLDLCFLSKYQSSIKHHWL